MLVDAAIWPAHVKADVAKLHAEVQRNRMLAQTACVVDPQLKIEGLTYAPIFTLGNEFANQFRVSMIVPSVVADIAKSSRPRGGLYSPARSA